MATAEKIENLLAMATGEPVTPVEKIYDGIEKAFDSVGMMSGTLAPVLRASVGFGLGTLVMYAARPSFAYTEEGEPRNFKLLKKQDEEATYFPWWTLPLSLSFMFGVMI